MIEVPNAGATPSGGAAAAPSGSGPAPGAAGDAARAEREAAGQALIDAGHLTAEQVAAALAEPPPVDNSVGTATAAMLDEIRAFAVGATKADAASLLEWEVKSGRISKGQADAILAGREPMSPASPAAPTQAAAPSTAAAQQVIAELTDFVAGLSPQEAARWLVSDVAAGRISKSQADAILAGRPAPVDASPESVAAMTTAAKAAEIDAAWPPAKAGQFDMPIFTDKDGSADSKDAIEAAAGARAALETAGFTKEIGGYIAKEIASVQKEWTGLDETGQEIYRRGQMAQLERMWNEKTPEKIALAQTLVLELEARHPGVMDLLDQTGAGNSATVIAQVVAHAERLLAKRGLKALPR